MMTQTDETKRKCAVFMCRC